ncbi:ACT domain-containing protein [Streptomyces sp. GTA36]
MDCGEPFRRVKPEFTGLFTKRHYNIESITVGHTETSGVSRITFVVHVEGENDVEQLTA